MNLEELKPESVETSQVSEPESKRTLSASERAILENEIVKAQSMLRGVCAKMAYHYKIPDAYNRAEDFAQETTQKALTHLASFNQNSKMSTWLITIAKNIIVDAARRKEWRVTDSIETDIEDADEIRKIEDLPVADELDNVIAAQGTITKILGTLEGEQAEIARLFFVEGMSLQEISEKFNIPVQNLKTRIFRIRDKLRNSFPEHAVKREGKVSFGPREDIGLQFENTKQEPVPGKSTPTIKRIGKKELTTITPHDELSQEAKEAEIVRLQGFLKRFEHPDVKREIQKRIDAIKTTLQPPSQDQKITDSETSDQAAQIKVVKNRADEQLSEAIGTAAKPEYVAQLEAEMSRENKLLAEIMEHYGEIEKFCFFAARKVGLTDWGNKAKDFAQEAIATAIKEIDSFCGDSSIEKWVMGIAFNAMRNEYRKWDKRMELRKDLQYIKDHRALSEDAIIARVDADKLRADLTDPERKMFDEFYSDAFSTKEIAARSGFTEGTIENKLVKIRKKLRKLYS